jgi:pyruvate formate lyase activating enzyme
MPEHPDNRSRVMDRRDFLAAVGRYGAGACGLCALGPLRPTAAAELPTFRPGPDARRVDFFESLPGRSTVCGVCPRHCVCDDGETGFCRSRTNVSGVYYPRGYARPAIVRVDPIEKLPLSHFRPGTKTMTVAVGGCNLRCLYCQNWQHSQAAPDTLETFDLPPDQAVQAARDKGLDTIAFNYTDPTASLEYATDLARSARKAEMRVVAATGAFIEPEPLLSFARHVDAFVVGLKGFTEAFYQGVVSGRLDGVQSAIETLKRRTDCWIEIVTLIVPTYNDDMRKIRELAGWVRRTLGVNTPLHFSRFVPMYRLTNLPRTPVETLEAACRTARGVGMKYVYTSNIAPHDGNNTYCPKCGAALIERLGFKVLTQRVADGRCPRCRIALPGRWT